MENLLQTSRQKIIESRLGIITDADLVQWADTKILELDEPPIYLIELSLGQLPEDEPTLDIVRTEINQDDCSLIMGTVLKRFKSGLLDTDQLGSVCYNFALLTKGRVSELLHWVSDEIHLCDVGVKNFSSSFTAIEESIMEIIRNDA